MSDTQPQTGTNGTTKGKRGAAKPPVQASGKPTPKRKRRNKAQMAAAGARPKAAELIGASAAIKPSTVRLATMIQLLDDAPEAERRRATVSLNAMFPALPKAA